MYSPASSVVNARVVPRATSMIVTFAPAIAPPVESKTPHRIVPTAAWEKRGRETASSAMTTNRSTAAFFTLLDDPFMLQTKGFIGPLPCFECRSSIKRIRRTRRGPDIGCGVYHIPQRSVKNKQFTLTTYAPHIPGNWAGRLVPNLIWTVADQLTARNWKRLLHSGGSCAGGPISPGRNQTGTCLSSWLM